MKKSLIALAAFSVFSTAVVAAPLTPKEAKGKGLYTSEGKRLGAVYRVDADGSAYLILNGKLVKVPASTLSVDGSKVVTSLSKKEVLATR